MKKFMLSILLALPLLALAWEVTLEPRRPRAGEWARLVFRTEKGEALPDPGRSLPEIAGLQFARNSIQQSTRIRIINGRRSHIVEKSLPFLAEKEGEYTIPLSKLPKWNSSTHKNFTFRVTASSGPGSSVQQGEERASSAGGELTWEEALFFRVEAPGKKKEYFPGEEVELDLSLYIVRGLKAQPGSYPVVDFGRGGKNMAVFRDHRKVNPENPDFEGVYRSTKRVNGRTYDVFTFRTAILPSLSGALPISAKINAVVTLPEERNSRRNRGGFFDDDDDPFFSSFFSRERRLTRVLTAPAVTLSIAKLPPLEKGAFYTELVGDFSFSASLSPAGNWKSGEVGNLTLTVTGTGNWDFLKFPPFTAPGFRAYPAEVKKSPGRAEASYVLIPVELYSGKAPNLFLPAMAWFDPGQGKYKYFRWAERMEIKKGPFAPAGGGTPAQLPLALPGADKEKRAEAPAVEEKEKDSRQQELFYLKEMQAPDRWTPEKKLLFFCILFGGLAACFPLAAYLFRKYRTLPGDVSGIRKKGAAKGRKEFFRKLAQLSPNELSSFAPEIASHLSDSFSLPPGSDLKGVAEFVKGKDLRLGEMLEKLAESLWMPGLSTFTEEFHKDLLKHLKRLLPLLLFAFLAVLPGTLPGAERSSLQQEEARARAAYDSGNFAESARLYKALLQKVKNDPALYYNCGNAYTQMGDDSMALACYERALRMNPRDEALRHNLSFVRKRLLLPSLDKTPGNPLEVLQFIRDRFLPEEWGILLAAGFLLIGFSFGMGILLQSPAWMQWGGGAGGVIGAIALIAILTLMPARYSGREAIVTGKDPQVYTLPSLKAPPSGSFPLKKGEMVEIREKRENWVRIQLQHHEGWIPRKDVTALWEGGE